MSFFSVVIPLFNKRESISETLKSVLNQTFPDFEAIIVDDGSTDGSLGVVESFCDPRIKIERKENGGVSSARNRGIEIASSEYIAFLDADDLWDPSFLSKMKELIKIYPNCGIYCSAMTICFPNGLKVSFTRSEREKGKKEMLVRDYFESCAKGQFMCASSIVIPKKIFDNCGKFKEARMAEDLEMWARIMLKYDMAYYIMPLTRYVKGVSLQATSQIKLESKYILFDTFYRMLSNKSVPKDKVAPILKYLDYKAKEEIQRLIFARKFDDISSFCQLCHLEVFSPKMNNLLKSSIATRLFYFGIIAQKIYAVLIRNIRLLISKKYAVKRGQNIVIYERTLG